MELSQAAHQKTFLRDDDLDDGILRDEDSEKIPYADENSMQPAEELVAVFSEDIDRDDHDEFDDEDDILIADNMDVVDDGTAQREIQRERIEKGLENKIHYKTSEVAKILNVSTQMIRNHSLEFEKYLNIIRTPTGHRLYTQRDIERLGSIIQMKKELGLDSKRIGELLEAETDPDNALIPQQRTEYILEVINENIKKTIQASLDTYINLIEDKNKNVEVEYTSALEETNELIKGMVEKINEKDAIIEELRLEKESYENEIKEIRELSEKNHEELMATLQEMNEKKKRKFPFFN